MLLKSLLYILISLPFFNGTPVLSKVSLGKSFLERPELSNKELIHSDYFNSSPSYNLVPPSLSECVVTGNEGDYCNSKYIEEFDKFKDNFKRTYLTRNEELNRFSTFKNNLIIIEKHNAYNVHNARRGNLGSKHTWKMKINKFTDISRNEFSKSRRIIPPIIKIKNKVKRITNELISFQQDKVNKFSSTIPNSIDWVAKGAVTPVKNQEQCGSCWAFSTTGSVEGAWFLKTGKLLSLSEQELVDCSTSFGNNGCEGGLMDNAFKFIEKKGLCTEVDYPYNATDGTACLVCNEAVKISSYTDVTPNNELALKNAVANQPVSIAIDATDIQFYSSGVYTGECTTNLDHGVLLVGYGNQMSSLFEGSNIPFWKVKNSWGIDWGESGYFRLLRNDSNIESPGMCGLAMMASYPVV